MSEIRLIAKPIKLFKKLEALAPQHLFILKIDNNSSKYGIRGGPKGGDGFINWLISDLEVTVSQYDSHHTDCPEEDRKRPKEECKGWDKLPSHTLAVGDESEISQYWEKSVKRVEWINKQGFDYKTPIEEVKKLYGFSFGGHLNSNTAARDIVEAMGLEFVLPKFEIGNGEEREVFAPGYDGQMEDSRLDKGIKWISSLGEKSREYVERDSFFLKELQGKYLENAKLGTKAQLSISKCAYIKYIKMRDGEDKRCEETKIVPSLREINSHKDKIYEYLSHGVNENRDGWEEMSKKLAEHAVKSNDCEVANIFKQVAKSQTIKKALMDITMSEEFHKYLNNPFNFGALDKSDLTKQEVEFSNIEHIIKSCNMMYDHNEL